MVVGGCEWLGWCAWPESNRHDSRRGIFLPLRLSPPACDGCSWSGLCLGPSPVSRHGRRAPAVKSLHVPGRVSRASLSVASLPFPRERCRGFAEFDGIHTGAFAAGCSNFKSLASTCFATGARVRVSHSRLHARRCDASGHSAGSGLQRRRLGLQPGFELRHRQCGGAQVALVFAATHVGQGLELGWGLDPLGDHRQAQ